MNTQDLAYVRTKFEPARPAPMSNLGLVVWLRRHLFATVGDTVLTLLGIAFLVWALPNLYNFLIGDAVFAAENGDACRAANVGACWAYVWARLDFFLYGFFPADPYWKEQAGLFAEFMAQWRVNLVFFIGLALVVPLLWPSAPFKVVNAALFFIVYPVVVFYLLAGGAFGLEKVPTEKWGGLTITLIIGLVGIVTSLPLGILLALGRQSRLPAIKYLSTGFIELWRAVPLITVLFMASVMLPLFMPSGVTIDKLLSALVGIALFNSAYMAEVVRGGLQALPRGQYEAASSLGLNYWKSMFFIILPQALKHVIPGIVNTFIALFKDTSLVSIIGIFDLLKTVQSSTADLDWTAPTQAITGYIFAAAVFWIFCFSMSRYSIFMENRLHTGHKR
ncbi:MAG: amino acid ABC transporter permease [Alphaproteobacteria bacterium]|nr:amino acid ABC transporter permease [Alphaproteobacteria bacterium]